MSANLQSRVERLEQLLGAYCSSDSGLDWFAFLESLTFRASKAVRQHAGNFDDFSAVTDWGLKKNIGQGTVQEIIIGCCRAGIEPPANLIKSLSEPTRSLAIAMRSLRASGNTDSGSATSG